jgi:Protein of unknown function (DUF4058)
MPVHDWTRVDAGLFHDFHQSWCVEIKNALNTGVLPAGYAALVEQRVKGPIPDVLTLKVPRRGTPPADEAGGGVATAPAVRAVRRLPVLYAQRADRVTVRHRHGDVIAVIEIVSPGNKATATEYRAFLDKAAGLIGAGVHFLAVDLFPPGRHDPDRLPDAILAALGGWDADDDDGDDDGPPLPADEPLTAASVDAGRRLMYAEATAVGRPLPDMPVFLRPGVHVSVPLDRTYNTTWGLFPAPFRDLLTPAD